MTTTTLGRRAAAAIIQALMTLDQCDVGDEQSELAITHPHDVATYRELLGAMAGHPGAAIRVVEWGGRESGRYQYRSYRGALPCGLSLDVVTEADRVPDLTA